MSNSNKKPQETKAYYGFDSKGLEDAAKAV